MSDIVTFLLPDGSEVSNDPRWELEKQMSAQQALLEATPNTGHAGIPDAEMQATMGFHDVEVPPADQLGRLSDGRLMQVNDASKAAADGNTPDSPGVEAPEPIDVNAKVQEARDKAEADRQEYLKQQESLTEASQADEEDVDSDASYEDMTGKQLQAEVKQRNAGRSEEDQIDTTGVKRKSELVKLLQDDDEKQG